eukprot:4248573-Pyramimonas_sp.AAC.1
MLTAYDARLGLDIYVVVVVVPRARRFSKVWLSLCTILPVYRLLLLPSKPVRCREAHCKHMWPYVRSRIPKT